MHYSVVPPELLERAAELRAQGASWAAVSEKIGIKINTVRRWPQFNRAEWDAHYTRALNEVLTSGRNEAMAIVRDTMRSDDNILRLAAAGRFLGHCRAPTDAVQPVDEDALRLAQYAGGLTDDDLARLAADADRCREPGGPAAAPVEGGVLPPAGPE